MLVLGANIRWDCSFEKAEQLTYPYEQDYKIQ